MEEKKPTDEEVVNALEERKQWLLEEQRRTGNSPEFQCLYITGIAVLEILDLIQRQKAEIERLTELQSRGSYRVAELGIENAEIQKQVDELTEERENMQAVIFALEEEKRELKKENAKVISFNDTLYREKQQAVKATAKEIFQEAKVHFGEMNGDRKTFEKWLNKRYGVEVE